ncbi:MAG: VOC family protein [Ilumatobacteraceae bacterium]
MIDHLVYGAADLPLASAAIAELLGVAPTPGGSHVGRGTYNELLSLGRSTYLEIIGPDPAQPAPHGPRPFGVDSITVPALVAWCVRPRRPLDDVVAAAKANGVDFGVVAAMSRRRPDGVLLEWELTPPQLDGPFGCALPFLIDWGSSAHPTETVPAAVRLVAFDVVHPNANELRAVLEVIGLTDGYETQQGPRPALHATIETRRGEITLTS